MTISDSKSLPWQTLCRTDIENIWDAGSCWLCKVSCIESRQHPSSPWDSERLFCGPWFPCRGTICIFRSRFSAVSAHRIRNRSLAWRLSLSALNFPSCARSVGICPICFLSIWILRRSRAGMFAFSFLFLYPLFTIPSFLVFFIHIKSEPELFH